MIAVVQGQLITWTKECEAWLSPVVFDSHRQPARRSAPTTQQYLAAALHNEPHAGGQHRLPFFYTQSFKQCSVWLCVTTINNNLLSVWQPITIRRKPSNPEARSRSGGGRGIMSILHGSASSTSSNLRVCLAPPAAAMTMPAGQRTEHLSPEVPSRRTPPANPEMPPATSETPGPVMHIRLQVESE